MLGQFVAVMVAIGMWPLILQSGLVALFATGLYFQVPRIWKGHYGFPGSRSTSWLWVGLGVTVLGVAVGTVLVMQAPWSKWPASLEAPPLTMVGLYMTAWVSAGWFVFTKILARRASRQEEEGENLEAYLGEGLAA